MVETPRLMGLEEIPGHNPMDQPDGGPAFVKYLHFHEGPATNTNEGPEFLITPQVDRVSFGKHGCAVLWPHCTGKIARVEVRYGKAASVWLAVTAMGNAALDFKGYRILVITRPTFTLMSVAKSSPIFGMDVLLHTMDYPSAAIIAAASKEMRSCLVLDWLNECMNPEPEAPLKDLT